MDDDVILFLQIEILELYRLPQLQEIWNGPISPYSFQNLKKIKIVDVRELKQLWTTSTDDDGGATLLPCIESLTLRNLPQLQEIWNGPIPSNSFQNLKEIKLDDLPVLKQLWSSTTGLPQLQSLEIVECEMMEQVITCREGRIELPRLVRLSIWKCPKLRNIIATSPVCTDNEDDHYSHLFCEPQKVSFGSLKRLAMGSNPFYHHNSIHLPLFSKLEELHIVNCHNSTSLFIPLTVKNLINLKILTIDDCDEMVKVIEDDNEENKGVNGGERYRLFPNLLTLKLSHLPKLEMFSKWKHDVELPSLTELYVEDCPNMARFTLGSTTAPHCMFFILNDYAFDVDASTDLNGALPKFLAELEENDMIMNSLPNQEIDVDGDGNSLRWQ